MFVLERGWLLAVRVRVMYLGMFVSLEFGGTALGYHGGFGFLYFIPTMMYLLVFISFSPADRAVRSSAVDTPDEKLPDQTQGPLISQLWGSLRAGSPIGRSRAAIEEVSRMMRMCHAGHGNDNFRVISSHISSLPPLGHPFFSSVHRLSEEGCGFYFHPPLHWAFSFPLRTCFFFGGS